MQTNVLTLAGAVFPTVKHDLRMTNSFGHCVRTLRKANGKTQVELARELGVGRRWLIDLENDRVDLRRIPKQEIDHLLETLGTTREEADVVWAAWEAAAARRRLSSPALEPAVTIDEPKVGSTVEAGTWQHIAGMAVNIGSEVRLWVVVHYRGLFYPQQQALQSGSRWEAWARLGSGPEQRGITHDVIVVTVDKPGHQSFMDWLERGADAGHEYRPLRGLPAGADRHASITVHLG